MWCKAAKLVAFKRLNMTLILPHGAMQMFIPRDYGSTLKLYNGCASLQM